MKKYTVITGASSGIGYQAAKAFAKRGKNVILVARRWDKLNELKTDIEKVHAECDVVVRQADLAKTENVYELYEDLKTYEIETWINNAGFGDYNQVSDQDLDKVENMINLNISALTILSTLYVRDYKDVADTQLINISSRGGYFIVPNAVTYCATKFYVSTFTEGLAHELHASGAALKAKVLAPAATQTEFGKHANDVSEYDYDKSFGTYSTSEEMAEYLLLLYDNEKVVGIVDFETFEFILEDPAFNYAGASSHNQKID